jgi:2-polyprenyl-3-methyl-5-hydroxy-6-metoxy-1,4-benzoquinol methylase
MSGSLVTQREAPEGVASVCAACGGSDRRALFVAGEGFRLEECLSCGLVATWPALPASEIGRYYPEQYYGEKNRRFNPLFERLVPIFRERRARQIVERTGLDRGRMLDVGCGRGILPAQMRDRGWQAHGIEISETAARHAREVLGLPVFVGAFEESPYEKESFDAIVIWHVLEHLPDPRAVLRTAYALLRPGGLLMIGVPNFDSLQAKLTGPDWFHLDVPRHYFHFRLGVLTRLLTEAGFAIEDVSHFNLEQNPYGWIQSLLNRAGFRFNLLYDLLKNPAARSERHAARRHPVQTVLTAALLPLVLPLSFLLFFVEVLLRRGGTVEVYARKR